MPTQSEQKALAFVAIVILLAGAVRVVKAGGPAEASQDQQQGLARQTFAANSAAVAQRAAKDARAKGKSLSAKSRDKAKGSSGPRFMAPKRRDAAPNVVGGVSSVPWDDRRGFPPPVPRIDSDAQPADTLLASQDRRTRTGRKKTTAAAFPRAGPIDLDTATEEAIETLPRIGPALARRIVANRDSLGPFRSPDGLRRVKGIGAATIALIGPLVTFSRQTRP